MTDEEFYGPGATEADKLRRHLWDAVAEIDRLRAELAELHETCDKWMALAEAHERQSLTNHDKYIEAKERAEKAEAELVAAVNRGDNWRRYHDAMRERAEKAEAAIARVRQRVALYTSNTPPEHAWVDAVGILRALDES